MNPNRSSICRKFLPSMLSGLLLLSSGCQATVYDRQSRDKHLPEHEQIDLASLLERIRVIESILPIFVCGPELRALLSEVREACDTPAESSEDSICREKQLKIAVMKAGRELDVSVGKKLLSVLRHEVLYLTPNGEISSRREQRLSVMAKERRLPSTKFLIIAGGEDGPQRARHARTLLIKAGIPEKEMALGDDGVEKEVSRFEAAWNYPLDLKSSDLKNYDRPSAMEPKDMSRAVFIFRTDYL